MSRRISGRESLQLLFVSVVSKVIQTWAAQPGSVGGQCPPTFGTRGYRGVQRGGLMKMMFASIQQSLFSTVQVTEFQLS